MDLVLPFPYKSCGMSLHRSQNVTGFAVYIYGLYLTSLFYFHSLLFLKGMRAVLETLISGPAVQKICKKVMLTSAKNKI